MNVSTTFTGGSVLHNRNASHVTTVANGCLSLEKECTTTKMDGRHLLYALLQLPSESIVDWVFERFRAKTNQGKDGKVPAIAEWMKTSNIAKKNAEAMERNTEFTDLLRIVVNYVRALEAHYCVKSVSAHRRDIIQDMMSSMFMAA